MEKEATDIHYKGSEFKVALYTGGESWGQVYWEVVHRMKCCGCFEPAEY